MKKKLKIFIISCSLVTAGFVSAGFTDSYFEIAKHIDIFTTLYKELNVFYVDETDPGELMKKGIDEMLKSLDPYTTYIPESEIEDFRFITTGQYGGIGAIITKREDFVYISEPYENYPAHKAGLMSGDKILEINGRSAKGKNTEEISEILKGEPNTSVTLLIERETIKDPIRFEVKFDREKISIKSVSYAEYVEEGLGYIKLRSFTKGCAKDVKEAILKLKKEGELRGLILDLRNNPGGLLNESVDIVNLFVEKGAEIVKTKGKIKSWEKVYVAKSKPLDLELPLVVLINSTSASASEIVSGSIQDLDRGIVIGERSYGKGLVQQTRKLTYNSQLKLTVAKYYTPSGRCIQALDYSKQKIKEYDEKEIDQFIGWMQNNKDGGINAEIFSNRISQMKRIAKTPDSLKTKFYTKRGRVVYDGGGINPDILTHQEELENIVASLFRERLFFDYATHFRIRNEKISNDFVFSDNDFLDFKGFIADKEYSYQTKTERALDNLKQKASNENYFENLESQYDLFAKELQINKNDDLSKSKEQIRELLTAEIMSRYFYQKGRVKANLSFDKDVEEAIDILSNNDKYKTLLEVEQEN